MIDAAVAAAKAAPPPVEADLYRRLHQLLTAHAGPESPCPSYDARCDQPGAAPGDGARCARHRARRGCFRRRRRHLRRARGLGRHLRRHQGTAAQVRRRPRASTRPSRESAIVGAAGGRGAGRACARWRRSCSPTSSACAWTRSTTRSRSSATCSAARRTCPVVIRMAMGAGMNMGAQHSQTIYALLTAVPGLKVVMPSNAYDAKGLHDPGDPRRRPGHVLRAQGALSAQGAKCRKRPTRCRSARRTSCARASMSRWWPSAAWCTFAEQALDALAEEGITCDLIDPRTTSPLDAKTHPRERREHRAAGHGR